jgi:hypothetical protein
MAKTSRENEKKNNEYLKAILASGGKDSEAIESLGAAIGQEKAKERIFNAITELRIDEQLAEKYPIPSYDAKTDWGTIHPAEVARKQALDDKKQEIFANITASKGEHYFDDNI